MALLVGGGVLAPVQQALCLQHAAHPGLREAELLGRAAHEVIALRISEVVRPTRVVVFVAQGLPGLFPPLLRGQGGVLDPFHHPVVFELGLRFWQPWWAPGEVRARLRHTRGCAWHFRTGGKAPALRDQRCGHGQGHWHGLHAGTATPGRSRTVRLAEGWRRSRRPRGRSAGHGRGRPWRLADGRQTGTRGRPAARNCRCSLPWRRHCGWRRGLPGLLPALPGHLRRHGAGGVRWCRHLWLTIPELRKHDLPVPWVQVRACGAIKRRLCPGSPPRCLRCRFPMAAPRRQAMRGRWPLHGNAACRTHRRQPRLPPLPGRGCLWQFLVDVFQMATGGMRRRRPHPRPRGCAWHLRRPPPGPRILSTYVRNIAG